MLREMTHVHINSLKNVPFRLLCFAPDSFDQTLINAFSDNIPWNALQLFLEVREFLELQISLNVVYKSSLKIFATLSPIRTFMYMGEMVLKHWKRTRMENTKKPCLVHTTHIL